MLQLKQASGILRARLPRHRRYLAKTGALLLMGTALALLSPSATAETMSGALKQIYTEQNNVYVTLDASANSCGSNRFVILANNPSREALKSKLGMNVMNGIPPKSVSIEANGCSGNAAIVVNITPGA
jgi:hypothetical protein